MEKILYLLGAGASAGPNAFPLAKSIYDEYGILKTSGLANALKNFDFNHVRQNIQLKESNDFLGELEKEFNDLAEEAEKFGDVDTYAKSLYLKGSNKFVEVKKILAAYFSLSQSILKIKDRRYLPWLVSLMNTSTFPDNVKILSWNYDYQIQLAFEFFGDLEDVSHNGRGFSYSSTGMQHYPSLDPTSDFERLCLIQLNGIAGYDFGPDSNTGSIYQKQFPENDEKISFLRYARNPRIHFAWERGAHQEKSLELVRRMIENTTILVVIGYSFPFFNRNTDRVIFEKLLKDGLLRKIYYQDPMLDGKQLSSQFDLPVNIDIVHREDVSRFYIPFEY